MVGTTTQALTFVVGDQWPSIISDRQFAQALAIKGLITQAEALAWVQIGAIPPEISKLLTTITDPTQQFAAQMLLAGAVQFERHYPLTDALASQYGWTSDQTDQFWAFAATL